MKLRTLTNGLIAIGLSTAIISPVLAQDDETYTLSPFSVTGTDGYTATSTISGTGLNTPLINVPMAINVITSDFLEDSHIGEFTHALDYNSSITQTSRNHNGGTRPQTFAIRGFRNSTILLDGVLGGHSLPTQMIDRIEVVKGPNTLYGQAEPGGLINVISKTPLSEQGGRATGIVGSNEWYQFKLDYTVRAMDDKLGLRVMTDQKETNGWRWVDGQKHNFLGVSGSYKWDERTDVDFLIAKNEVNGFPTQRATWSFQRIPTDLNGDGDTLDTVGGIGESNTRYNNQFLPPEYVSSTPGNIYESDNDFLQFGIRHSFSENHNIQYKYNFNDSHNLQTFREFNTFNPDGSNPVNSSVNDSRGRDEVHTINDIIVLDGGEVRHQILVGARKSEATNGGRGTYRLRYRGNPLDPEMIARRQIEERRGITLRDILYREDIENGVPIWEDPVPTVEEFFTMGVRSNTNDRSFQDITNLYLSDNITFADGDFTLLVGVRHIDLEQFNTALGGAVTSRLTGSDTNFQFGGVYRVNPNLSLFASTADAFRPQNRTDPDTGELVGPQTSEAYELGVKFADLYDGKLSGSVALFRIEQDNVFRADHNPVTFVSDSAITNDLSEGLEFELFYNPTDNFNIVAAYSYIDAKVVGEVATGLPLEGATPHRLTLFTNYTVQEGPLEGARFGGGLVFADGPIQQFGNIANSLVVEDGYTTFDFFARIPVTFGERDWDFGINIDNVTDEFFVRSRAATNEARQVLFSLSTDL